MRKQYHFRPSENGFYAWDVDKLVAKTKGMEWQLIKLSDVRELDQAYWYGEDSMPTCRSVTDHCRLINDADLSYPVILSSDGSVMDGMHRICRALMEGQDSIKAYKFAEHIEPDFVDVHPDDLHYPD